MPALRCSFRIERTGISEDGGRGGGGLPQPRRRAAGGGFGRMRLLLLAALGLTAAEPDSWPGFRGPASNPVSANAALPDRWSKTENIEWSVNVPGRGWSSPVVAAGKVFVTAVVTDGKSKEPKTGTEYSNQYVAELTKQGLSEKEVFEKVNARDMEMPHEVTVHYWLYCFDLKSGAMRWKREYHAGRPPGGRHRKNSFASETPVTDGKAVYVYAGNLGLYAFDLKGKPLWKAPVDSDKIYLEFGTGASPVLKGDLVLIAGDAQTRQFLAAFDKRTGKAVWRTARDIGPPMGEMSVRSGWSTPFVWTNALRTEIITVGPLTAISYDGEGKELWRMAGMTQMAIPSPFAVDGVLYLDAGRGGALYAVKAGASGDISLPKGTRSNDYVMWTEPRGGTYMPTPV
ncbi:MAG: hypothetical protein FJW30_30340, partial [Acidobacteria bacterium]|nr:hypothetical protein [Acidobacteriota bacterium]